MDWNPQAWFAPTSGTLVGMAGRLTGLFSHAPCNPKDFSFCTQTFQRGSWTSYIWLKCKRHFLSHGPQMPSDSFIGFRVFWPSTKKATGEKTAVSFSNLWGLIWQFLEDYQGCSWSLSVETYSTSISTFQKWVGKGWEGRKNKNLFKWIRLRL